jgi:hypothetical protein
MRPPRAIDHEAHEAHEDELIKILLSKKFLTESSCQQALQNIFFVIFVRFVFQRSC